jgi:hypothetical protein
VFVLPERLYLFVSVRTPFRDSYPLLLLLILSRFSFVLLPRQDSVTRKNEKREKGDTHLLSAYRQSLRKDRKIKERIHDKILFNWALKIYGQHSPDKTTAEDKIRRNIHFQIHRRSLAMMLGRVEGFHLSSHHPWKVKETVCGRYS